MNTPLLAIAEIVFGFLLLAVIPTQDHTVIGRILPNLYTNTIYDYSYLLLAVIALCQILYIYSKTHTYRNLLRWIYLLVICIGFFIVRTAFQAMPYEQYYTILKYYNFIPLVTGLIHLSWSYLSERRTKPSSCGTKTNVGQSEQTTDETASTAGNDWSAACKIIDRMCQIAESYIRLEEKIKKDLGDNFEILDRINLAAISYEYNESLNRLNREVASLGRRGTYNLIIGMISTFIAIVILLYLVINMPSGNTHEQLLWYFMPRLSLAVLIEFFAFFFLKLYRGALEDIKYFQNEITNIEAKFTALEGAITLNDRDAVKNILGILVTTERNFILKKGESTVALQKTKLEQDDLTNIIKSFKETVRLAK